MSKFTVGVPGHLPFDAEHAVVYTLPMDSSYYPLGDLQGSTWSTQIAYIGVYVALWVPFFVWGARAKQKLVAPTLGFTVGLVLLLVSTYFYVVPNNVLLFEAPGPPYVANTPSITVPKRGSDLKDPDKYVSWDAGVGNYQLITKGDKAVSHESKKDITSFEHIGHVFPVKAFLKKVADSEINATSLQSYIATGITADGDFKPFNAGSQAGAPKAFSETDQAISSMAYYTCLIVVTWALYLNQGKGASSRQIRWIILAFIISTIASASVVSEVTVERQNFASAQKRAVLILAISAAATSIFVD